MDEAWVAFEAGNPVLAEKLSRRAVSAGRVNARLWLEHGRILWGCGRRDEATEAVRQAIALAPNHAEAFAELAGMQAERGKLAAAVRLQQRVIELRPNDPQALVRLEELRGQLPEGAEEHAVESAPVHAVGQPALRRTEDYDWEAVGVQLAERGLAPLRGLLDRDERAALIDLWGHAGRFDHETADRGGLEPAARFFADPLPDPVKQLRRELYARLAPIANAWQEQLGRAERFPTHLAQFTAHCRAHGQRRGSVALLRYTEGAVRTPQQGLGSGPWFPLEVAVTLGPDSTAERGGAELRLCDIRPGRRLHERRIGTAAGDGVVYCGRVRLVRIGGALGLQPVSAGLTEVVGAERFELLLPFHEHG
ncbi:MAG: 2OG-Fe(II) oxygenase [Planctomycetes bacterium]|nr:2OG-Fe(II) oxygenase [Planctomycetota bacterium]